MSTNYLSNPSKDYSQTVAAMRSLLKREGEDTVGRAFAEAVHISRREAFASTQNIVERKKDHVCFHRLMGKKCPGESCLSPTIIPGQDHSSEWLSDGKTSIIYTQPYSLGHESLKDLVSFCESNQLEVTIDAGSSWHFPGRTIGIRISKTHDIK